MTMLSSVVSSGAGSSSGPRPRSMKRVSSSTRVDPQAKGLGEWLRARVVELPVELLERQGG